MSEKEIVQKSNKVSLCLLGVFVYIGYYYMSNSIEV